MFWKPLVLLFPSYLSYSSMWAIIGAINLLLFNCLPLSMKWLVSMLYLSFENYHNI